MLDANDRFMFTIIGAAYPSSLPTAAPMAP